MSFLRWTSKSTAKLAEELVRQGFKITDDTVGRILKDLGYSLQAPAKEKEGTAHPDRDAQFRYLNKQVGVSMKAGQPVISVDTKKKLRHEVARSERTRRSEVRLMPAV
jgi:arginine repressor